METTTAVANLLALIEGAFGALLMIIFGVGAIFSVFVSAGVIVYSLIKGQEKGKKFYIKWACLPLVCLALSIGTFCLRAMVSFFFGAEAQQVSSLFVQTLIG